MLKTVLTVAAVIFFVLAFFNVGKDRRLSFEWLASACMVAVYLVGKI